DRAAHFLMKLMFCMFADDIDLLPDGVFTKVITRSRRRPAKFSHRLARLFRVMSRGGDFGADPIRYFNGGLFADADVIDLPPDEIEALLRVNECDWGSVEPSVFGTLFERTLNPSKGDQIGTHYTSKEDVLAILEPVVLTPLKRQWEAVRE